MNAKRIQPAVGTLLAPVAMALLLLGGCSYERGRPDGAAALRSRLAQLQSDPQLAGRAPLAMEQASRAVAAAGQPQRDAATSDHLVFMADRRLSIAAAEARDERVVAERTAIRARRAANRLEARTAEADAAAAGTARTVDLQRQVDGLQGRTTYRGLVLVFGDDAFASGSANLLDDGDGRMARLADYLNRNPRREARIEGHSDNLGTQEKAQAASQRRADSVKAFLVARGVAARRLGAVGLGQGSPVGDNGTEAGRQQNRRVEVILLDEPPAVH